MSKGSYAKIYHKVLTDPKSARLTLSELGAYVLCIVWCSREETDGHFDYDSLSSGCRFRGLSRSLHGLVKVGLLSRDGRDYVVKGYSRYQTTKASIEAKRAATALRVQNHRDSCNGVTEAFSSTETRDQRPENKDLKSNPPTPKGDHKPEKKPRTKKPLTTCPDDFWPSTKDESAARGGGVNVEELVAEMVDWSKQNPNKNRKADWSAAFRAWARKRASEVAIRRERDKAFQNRFSGQSDNMTEHDKRHVEEQRSRQLQRSAEHDRRMESYR